MQLVVHAPFGGRVNRALGLALRKRFCRRFDFELQAAASDDAVVLSLGPQHSFPLEDVPQLPAPANGARRSCAGAAPRRRCSRCAGAGISAAPSWCCGSAAGGGTPPPIQRMEADDLMAAVFPALAGCQENAGAGPIEIPDHPLVRQTMHDCLHEAIDVDGLVRLFEGFRSGRRASPSSATRPSPRRWPTRS